MKSWSRSPACGLRPPSPCAGRLTPAPAASPPLVAAVREQGGTLVGMESYDRSPASLAAATKRLRDKGGYDSVLIADGGRMSAQAGPIRSW